MEPAVELTLMSIAMFFGCYLAGKLPMILQNRESKGQLMSVFGAGMLVGTAFTVIIPEGIRTLYEDCGHSKSSSPPEHVSADANVEEIHAHEHGGKDNEFIIALSLLFGFLFMLLVDKLASSHHSNRSDPEAAGSSSIGKKVCTATLGLVVHAAADGIALGAAAASHHSDVEFIVFFAIMLHKAPTAFGLTSFLVRQGSDTRRINRLLLVFSAAAPLGAFGTYAIINVAGNESSVSSTSNSSVAMLFSAGTFLYVATVHIIPELMISSSESEGGSSNNGGNSGGHLSWTQLFTMILGAFIPLLFSLGHHH